LCRPCRNRRSNGSKVHINIDNISILEQFGTKYGDSYPVFLRINPHIFAGGNYKISTGHIDSKFGISIHQMRHIERVMKSTNLNVEGFTCILEARLKTQKFSSRFRNYV
jgi:diaminopimelate decarboxylase